MLPAEKGEAKEVIDMRGRWSVCFTLLLVGLFINGGCAGHLMTASKKEDIELLQVSKRGDIQEIAELISRGADINARAGSGETPLSYASFKGHKDVVNLLIEKGADVNIRDSEGDTPLMLAANGGHIDIVRTLISRGADVNNRNKQGNTALLYNSYRWKKEKRKKDIAELLISKGADVNIENNKGESALDRAQAAGREDIVKLLQSSGALK